MPTAAANDKQPEQEDDSKYTLYILTVLFQKI